jgi:predicted NACHT family NTPase
MKPDELINLIATFKQLISELFFNGQEPQWLASAINYSLLLLLLLLGLWGVLVVIGQCIKIWAEQIRPLYYDQAQKKRLRDRQRFANHIEQEIRQLNSREEWKDYRFTELEAEVEAEGKRLRLLPLPFIRSTRRGLRREQSLSKALELSGERLILLAGDPGSGKSIALRHVAEKLALRSS